jgi:hypothetical protein
VRLVQTVHPKFGLVRRPYVRLVIGGSAIPAIVDSGADASSIDELTAQAIHLPYTSAGITTGIGGPVAAFRAARAVVTLVGPRARRAGVEWVEVGGHEVELAVLRSVDPLPALVGRVDLLVHYRFVLRESDGEFELTPVRATQ